MDLIGPIVGIVDGLVNRDLRMKEAQAAKELARAEAEKRRQEIEAARLEAERMRKMMLYGVAGLGVVTVGFLAYKMLAR